MHRAHLGLAALALLAACTSSPPPQPAPAPRPTPAARGNANENASTAARLGIPPGHLPEPGTCRVWLPGVPPGQQKKAMGKGRGKRGLSGDCDAVLASAPAGSWVVYRPGQDRKVVYVREVDRIRPGVVVRVRIFDAVSGAFLREEAP